MFTSDPKPHSKRKAPDDSNPLLNAAKRSKRELKSNASKRKFIGEEQAGGLDIVRAPISRPSSPQNNHSSQTTLNTRPPSRPPSSQAQRHPQSLATPGNPSQPKHPSKKFKADNSHAATHVRNGDLLPTSREDPGVDEDVRRMNSEIDHLRQRSIGNGIADPNIHFLPPSSSKPNRHPKDSLHPLPESETPQIERNKLFREGLSRARQPSTSPAQQHSRRSSISTRGKRISTSFEATGIITQPHTSVSDSSFYKHIDCDLPEPQRARQLLIWSTSRAMNTLAEASSSSSNSRRKSSAQANGKDPPLSERGQQALKVVQEDMMRMLAEGRINTNVYGKNMPEGTGNGQVGEGSKFKPNEQNLKNRAREIKFTEHIDRAKAEQEAWVHVDQFYNSYQTNSLADLEKRRRALTPPSSLKAKGKQRATSVEPGDDWRWLLPREEELPEAFRGKNGVELAKRIMEERFESGEESPISQRMEDVRFKIDSLFSFTNSAVRMTETAEAELDHRFSLLSLVLSARAESAPPPTQSPTSLSSYLPLPSRGRSQPSSSDPQDLLRALCRVDLDRPPGKVGDAARRAAREVQRVQEGGGVGERRLTGIAPGIGATPRKVPGTPRRKDR